MEPNLKQAIPFFGVTDIERSLRFYVDGLGFEMTKSWKPEGRLRWCWLQRGEAAVMLQEFQTDGNGLLEPKGTLGKGVSINFLCDDALELYREFTSRSIAMKRPFVGNAMWVISVEDPDGYNLFFESPTDVPEESEWTE